MRLPHERNEHKLNFNLHLPHDLPCHYHIDVDAAKMQPVACRIDLPLVDLAQKHLTIRTVAQNQVLRNPKKHRQSKWATCSPRAPLTGPAGPSVNSAAPELRKRSLDFQDLRNLYALLLFFKLKERCKRCPLESCVRFILRQ